MTWSGCLRPAGMRLAALGLTGLMWISRDCLVLFVNPVGRFLKWVEEGLLIRTE